MADHTLALAAFAGHRTGRPHRDRVGRRGNPPMGPPFRGKPEVLLERAVGGAPDRSLSVALLAICPGSGMAPVDRGRTTHESSRPPPLGRRVGVGASRRQPWHRDVSNLSPLDEPVGQTASNAISRPIADPVRDPIVHPTHGLCRGRHRRGSVVQRLHGAHRAASRPCGHDFGDGGPCLDSLISRIRR